MNKLKVISVSKDREKLMVVIHRDNGRAARSETMHLKHIGSDLYMRRWGAVYQIPPDVIATRGTIRI